MSLAEEAPGWVRGLAISCTFPGGCVRRATWGKLDDNLFATGACETHAVAMGVFVDAPLVTCGRCGVENEHSRTTCSACGYCWQVVDVPDPPPWKAHNAVTIDKTIPGADGHVSIECTLPDGRRVRVTVEPEGEVGATYVTGGKREYRDVPISDVVPPVVTVWQRSDERCSCDEAMRLRACLDAMRKAFVDSEKEVHALRFKLSEAVALLRDAQSIEYGEPAVQWRRSRDAWLTKVRP